MIAVLMTAALLGADLPPSPVEHPGTKQWLPPGFLTWPAVVHPGEERHAVVRLNILTAGGRVPLTWEGTTVEVPLPMADGWIRDQEPPGTPTTGALVVLPDRTGDAVARTPQGAASLRLVDAAEAWPHHRLDHGGAVDDAGRPVVLRIPAHDATAERRFAVLERSPTRPTGPPAVLGDLLGNALADLPGITVVAAQDHRGASHPALVALAHLLRQSPRSLAWSPGTTLFTAPAEEDRVLGAVVVRCRALGIAPRLILLLPTERPGHPEDRDRRQALAQAAVARGWRVVSTDHWSGPEGQRLAPDLWAAGPVGPARERLRRGLAAMLQEP